MNYLEIINRRRSVYTLTDRLPIGENELVGIVEETVVATPSPLQHAERPRRDSVGGAAQASMGHYRIRHA